MDYRAVWLIAIVPAILLELLSWPHILSHFKRLLREETDPDRRGQYRGGLLMTYPAAARGLLRLAFVPMGGIVGSRCAPGVHQGRRHRSCAGALTR